MFLDIPAGGAVYPSRRQADLWDSLGQPLLHESRPAIPRKQRRRRAESHQQADVALWTYRNAMVHHHHVARQSIFWLAVHAVSRAVNARCNDTHSQQLPSLVRQPLSTGIPHRIVILYYSGVPVDPDRHPMMPLANTKDPLLDVRWSVLDPRSQILEFGWIKVFLYGAG